jgi:hypothetical protein
MQKNMVAQLMEFSLMDSAKVDLGNSSNVNRLKLGWFPGGHLVTAGACIQMQG